MTDLSCFMLESFEYEYCSKTPDERQEFLSELLNKDKTCVLSEKIDEWVCTTIDKLIPNAPPGFRDAILHTIDYDELCEDIFHFLESEDSEYINQ
jgi:hypothetical protein